MRVIRCPNCNTPLPAQSHYCSACGESQASPTEEMLATKTSSNNSNADAAANTSPAFDVPHFNNLEANEKDIAPQFIAGGATHIDILEKDKEADIVDPGFIEGSPLEDISIQRIMEGLWEPPSPNVTPTNGNHNGVLIQENDELDETIEDAWHSRTNWHREVIARSSILDSPTGGDTPPGLLIPPPSLLPKRRKHRGIVFWVSVLLLLGLVMGGLFGLALTLGRGIFLPSPPAHAEPTLQVTPSSVALGALISLHGTHFTPNGRIGFSYDANIPIIDTDGNNVIRADKHGSFTDTAIVEPEWQAGPHTIHAEDATLHKIASFSVLVTGQSPSLRPAHLQLSATSVDLGSGNQATNSMQTLTLTNIGGGLVNWQTAVTQPWLMTSPKSGTFANNQSVQVVIAASRSNLAPGSYTGSVIFTSNAGQIDLPVKMQVTSLQPGPQPILQLTPATLNFSATDGGNNPSGQVITISNPGTKPLQWTATSISSSPITNGNGPNWLAISPQSGTVAPGASQAVTIGTNISALLPGVYDGLVTFTSQGAEEASGSPQSIYVSLTVLPQCQLQVTPGVLSFAGGNSQAGPAAKTINVGMTQGCSSSLQWSATTTSVNGGHWLAIDGQGSASGSTPDSPAVSVNIAGLAPGTYTGAVVFSSTEGTQTVPVTLNIGQSATPIMLTTPATMSFNAMVGQSNPATQTITISNNGSGPLTWNAAAATAVGGSWLAVKPASGTLSPQQSTTVTVTATALSSLTPALYNGIITINGLDSAGHPASGSPQQIPVTFNIQAACAISVGPTSLNFTGVVGQSNVETQAVRISTNGTCGHSLDWTSTTYGSSWLTTTPANGQVNQQGVATTHVEVALTGLAARTYTGTVSISAIDSVTHQPVGTPQTITVTLSVQPQCTLQSPSSTQKTFNAEAGSNPAAQALTVSVIGNCAGAVTITPTVTMATGAGWLAVSPPIVTIQGGSGTFEVHINSASLPAATYSGSISLSAVDNGITISGSPQTISVTLNVLTSAALSVAPGSLVFNANGGVASQVFTISNTGGEPLKWQASLPANAPPFVRLSANSGNNLAAGASVGVRVYVDSAGIVGGTTFTTTVTVRAVDAITGAVVAGSPARVSIRVNVASSPSLQVNSSQLFFRVVSGNVSQPQFVIATNPSTGTITWTASVPAGAPWLEVNPANASETPGASTPITFTADATNMQPGTYRTVVTITPAGGAPIQVVVRLLVLASKLPPPPTPTPAPPTPTATKVATTPPTPPPTATSVPTTPPAALPVLEVSSHGLLLNAKAGTTSQPQTITITNAGGGTLTWTVNVLSDGGWLQVDSTSGSDGPGESSTLTFTANATNLQPGFYIARVIITSSKGRPVAVFVRLRVTG
jgi:hypothetical protein